MIIVSKLQKVILVHLRLIVSLSYDIS